VIKADCLVLGAGMVGVSAALHLQKRGRSVVLVDRRGAAEETSFGNAGIIQREGIVPYGFPREWSKILKYAMNGSPDAHLHWRALPSIAPQLWRYWRHGTAERLDRSARAMKPLIERVVGEHGALMQEAGIIAMMRRTGYLKLYRDRVTFEAAIKADEIGRRVYGVTSEVKDVAAIQALEPHLAPVFVGGLLMAQPVSVADPSAVGKAYAELFRRNGGRFVTGDARTLEPMDGGWRVRNVDGDIAAREAVIALGPWSDVVLAGQGVRVPLGVKRGYHMHYKAKGNATLARPVIDTDNGLSLVSMTRGIRLTTGVEFALRDAPATPVQLERVEPAARGLFPLGERLDAAPWLGARPYLPDMVPMIGPVPGKPGLWADFGHHHLGFTLGPVSGRLLAEQMTGAAPFTDPHPYRVDRFA